MQILKHFITSKISTCYAFLSLSIWNSPLKIIHKIQLIENKEVTDQDKIAVLRVKDTTSYQILFLNDYNSMDEIDKEIDETLDGKIYNFNIRKILEGHLNA